MLCNDLRSQFVFSTDGSTGKPKMMHALRRGASVIKASMPKIRDVNVIDTYSRVIFPVCFLMFNAVYWVFYVIDWTMYYLSKIWKRFLRYQVYWNWERRCWLQHAKRYTNMRYRRDIRMLEICRCGISLAYQSKVFVWQERSPINKANVSHITWCVIKHTLRTNCTKSFKFT